MKLSLIIAIISYASGVVGHTLRGSQQHNEQNNEDITLYSSLWHDVPPHPVEYPGEDNIINFAVEIPLHIRAKMEMQKTIPGNPIQQDHFDDGSLRFYSYNNPFFNYGYIPQTWEDPELLDELGNGGDNDPLDVMEVGSQQLTMGSIVPSRVLGALTLIDEGQMDNKIIVLALSDPDADRIYNLDDLEAIKPGMVDDLVDWLKMYKTTDGAPENALVSDEMSSVREAIDIINMTNDAWVKMCKTGDDHDQGSG